MRVKYQNDMTPFDMAEKPREQMPVLMPLIWGGAYFLTRQFDLKIHKENMEKIDPPYLVLATHQGPADYYVGPLALFPHRAMYVSDMEGFYAYGKKLYRRLGCIGKRRFVPDVNVVRNIKYALELGQPVVIYPEARHSNVGTTALIPKNLGRLCKYLDVPVVTLTVNGSYLANPFWDEEHTRKVPMEAMLECICTKEQLSRTDPDRLQRNIEGKLQYDEYRYQQENQIMIREPNRAEGLHKALYQCRKCGTKYRMKSHGSILECEFCSTEYLLTEDGYLENLKEKQKVHIPDWYDWERKQVQANPERFGFSCRVEALPNEKGFVNLGEGELFMDETEFRLKFRGEELHFPHVSRESVQTEYNYKGKGMCIVLSNRECSYYVYSDDPGFNATLLQFSAEYYSAAARGRK